MSVTVVVPANRPAAAEHQCDLPYRQARTSRYPSKFVPDDYAGMVVRCDECNDYYLCDRETIPSDPMGAPRLYWKKISDREAAKLVKRYRDQKRRSS